MSFETRCPVLHRPGCFRPSDQLAGWDSHPLEIADLHGVLSLRHSITVPSKGVVWLTADSYYDR